MATLTSEYQYLGRSSKLTPQSGSYGYYILLYGKTVPNTTTGYHTVSTKMVLACTIDSSFYGYGTTYSGTINGTTAFSGTKKPSAAWELSTFSEGGYSYKKGTVIDEGTVSVDCSNGSAKNVLLDGTWKFTVTGTTYTPNKDATGTVSVTATLPAIARKNTVTATDAYIGAVSTIVINKNNTANTSTLSYKIEGQSTYTEIIANTSVTQYGWTVPETVYQLIPNSKEIKIYILCETFSGSTSMGTNETYMTASVRESENLPEASVTAADVNSLTLALTGDSSKLVKGFSNLQVQTTATAKNGASIASVRVVCGSVSGSGADVTLNSVESSTVTVTITDSRGISSSISVPELTLIEYIPLTVNVTTQRTSDSDTVSVSSNGNYFSGSFGTTTNSLTVKARVKSVGGSYGDYTNLTTTISGNSYSATGSLTGVSYTSAYDVEVTAYDAVNTVGVSSVYRINKSIPVFDWGENDFRFNVPTTIPRESPLIVTGTGTTDLAMNTEIQNYAYNAEDGYMKFIYIPSTTHSLLGSYPFLVESFKYNNDGTVRVWLRALINFMPQAKEFTSMYMSGLWVSWQESKNPSVSTIWTGTLNNTSTTVNLGTLGTYNAYIIKACPKSGSSSETLVIPKTMITSTATEYQIADELNYVVFSIYYTGSTVYLKWARSNGGSSALGYVSSVTGMN